MKKSRSTKRGLYEHRTHPLLSHAAFLQRVLRHGLLVILVITLGLGIGVLGYHCLGELGWVDSLLNASMILGGMGPVDPMRTTSAKLFASFYALFSGLVFIGVSTVVAAPFVHRMLHRFHLAEDEEEEGGSNQ